MVENTLQEKLNALNKIHGDGFVIQLMCLNGEYTILSTERLVQQDKEAK